MDEPGAGRKAVVCGDMLELGDQSPQYHHRAGAELAAAGIDLLVAVGAFARDVVDGWQTRADRSREALAFPTQEVAWRPLWQWLRPGDAVLLKGSRLVGLEKIVENIERELRSHEREAAA
jgi:UDP-N-acetylmuramoyl-tripeptide--D-alanyl-D-alanine ligase